MKSTCIAIALTLVISACLPVFAQEPESKITAQEERSISDFLVDLDPGAVSAADLIGVSASAVTTIYSPKDFIAAFTGGGENTKEGIGLSITPARTSLSGVSIRDYREGNFLVRAWANTTFSYAQNKKEQSSIEYRQDAIAARISFYLDPANDPAIATHSAFINCLDLLKLMRTEAELIQEKLKGVSAADIPSKIEQIKAEAKAEAETNKANKASDPGKETKFQLAANAAVKSCIQTAPAPSWNATQFALIVGQGWIKGPQGNTSKLSLGRDISFAAAIGIGKQSILNLTLRRSDHALDLSSISTTPTYRSSNIAAARFTYGHGDAPDTYVLAEISNAKSSSNTLANSAFKYALGVDRRILGSWIEFRFGRGKSFDGAREETKALLTLKLSPTSTIPKAAGG